MTDRGWFRRASVFAPPWRALRIRVAAALLMTAVAAPAAAADPLTLILLRLLRDQLITKSLEAAWESRSAWAPSRSQQPRAEPSFAMPVRPAELDDAGIRRMIDDGFVHLSTAQRAEVYVAVQRVLADPEHAASRAVILEELAVKAAATRHLHDQLRQLSDADKQRIAAQARAEYARLSDDERQQLLHVLRTGAVPIPRDLSDSILAELAR